MVRLVTSRTRKSDLDDLPTLAAVGILAATAAAVAHEAVGHGGACLAVGGEVTRLTSIFFRCRGGGDLVDAAGPLAQLAWGAAALAIACVSRLPPILRLFLLTTAAISLLWVFGQLVRDAALAADDWAFTARSPALRWSHVAIGAAGYALTVRLLVRPARALAGGDVRRLVVPWAVGALSAALAGALWSGHRLDGVRDSLLAVALAPLGYLLTIRSAVRSGEPPAPIGRSWPWILAAVAVYAAFAFSLGLGRLA